MESVKDLSAGLRALAKSVARTNTIYRRLVEIPRGRTHVTAKRLVQAGMAGHFKSAPTTINSDCVLLDKRQLRRLVRVEKRAGVIHRKSVKWSIPRWQIGPAYG